MIPLLPVELIVEIGKETQRLADKKNLRLTCSFLGDVLKSHVLSSVILDIHIGNTESGFNLLEALLEDSKSEQSTVCKHIRTLYINSLSPSHASNGSKPQRSEVEQRHNFWSRSKSVSEAAEKRLQSLLGPALKTLHNLETFRWHWELKDAPWTYHTIMGAISYSTLRNNLKEFAFHHSGSFRTPPGMRLPEFSQLRRLSLHGNLLSEDSLHDILSTHELDTFHVYRHGFHFSLMERDLPSSISDLGLDGWFIDVPRIIHKNLTSLNLGEMVEYLNSHLDDAIYVTREDAFNSLWNILRLEHINLRNLAAPFMITDALLEYICSYSGLESLALKGHADWSVDGDNSSRFYKHALPMHRNTLTRLEMSPEYEDEWCFGVEHVEAFSILKKLRFLMVGVHTRGLDADPLELPDHSIYRKDGNFPNSVHVLLHMICSSLPNLETVTMVKAVGLANSWGSPKKYNEGIKRRLYASVKSFAQHSLPNGGCGSDVFRWVKIYVEDERVNTDNFQELEQGNKERKWGLPMLKRITKRLSLAN